MEGSLVAYKVFTNGSVLNASEIQQNLMDQSVMVFSNSTARSAALTSPIQGMVTYLEDTDQLQNYNGSGWVTVGGSAGIGTNTVSTPLTSVFSTSIATGTWADLTGLSLTITPSTATSKILLIAHVSGSVGVSASNVGMRFRFMRGATGIGLGDAAGSRTPGSFGGLGSGDANEHESNITYSGLFLDSPATASAVTYNIQVGHRSITSETILINRSRGETDTARFDRNISTLTAIEVAA
jgi:hypothetical protein